MKLSKLYNVCMNHFKEFAPLKGKGVVKKEVNGYLLKITADKKMKDDGIEIKPFAFHIFKNGWIAAIVYPHEGATAIDEDKLIEELGAK